MNFSDVILSEINENIIYIELSQKALRDIDTNDRSQAAETPA